MSQLMDGKDILLASASILITFLVAYVLKKMFYGIKRPNGKKGGIISFHIIIGFSIVSSIALISRDWFITALTIVLAYIIGRDKLEQGKHYMYQIILSAVIGVIVPYLIIYMYNNRGSLTQYSKSDSRKEYDDKPEKAIDERNEADLAPDLKLEEVD